MANDHYLTLSCGDKPGIVHAVTGVFAASKVNRMSCLPNIVSSIVSRIISRRSKILGRGFVARLDGADLHGGVGKGPTRRPFFSVFFFFVAKARDTRA